MNCGDREYSLSCTLNSIITTSSDAFSGSPPVSKRLNILAVTLFICILKLFYWTHIIILIEVREWGNTALTVSNLKSSSSRIPSGIFQIIQLAVFSCPHIPLFWAKRMHGRRQSTVRTKHYIITNLNRSTVEYRKIEVRPTIFPECGKAAIVKIDRCLKESTLASVQHQFFQNLIL